MANPPTRIMAVAAAAAASPLPSPSASASSTTPRPSSSSSSSSSEEEADDAGGAGAAAAAASAAGAGGAPPAHHQQQHNSEEPTWFAALTTYLGFATLILFGHLRDFLAKLTGRSRYFKAARAPPPGYAPLLQDWENFYTRRLYHRIQDCWNRPIEGPPLSGKLPVVMRETTDGNFSLSLAKRAAGAGGKGAGADAAPAAAASSVRTCINLSSYNYLGFADDWKETCRADVMGALGRFPVSVCASFAEGGYLSLHRELERSVADFVGKEDAVIFNMGWATNGLGIPSIVGKGCLIISDSLNHNSIVAGARSSGAEVRVFRHNDLDGLEALIKKSILDGQPHRNRQWRKILVAIEGIYSMEGESVDLLGVVRIAKRHKCYVYLDEAHSIGAMGANGRGICEHAGVDPALVDVLMGTFTKSFGAMGGYIAGSREFVAHVRRKTAGFLLDNAMSPIVCQQILTAFRVMKGEDGTSTGLGKITRLRENSDYFRQRLIDMGLDVFGCEATSRARAQARADARKRTRTQPRVRARAEARALADRARSARLPPRIGRCPQLAAALPRAPRSFPASLRQPRYPGDDLQPDQGGGLLARVPGAPSGRRRRRLPGHAADHGARALLHLGGAHARGARPRARHHQRGRRRAHAALQAQRLRIGRARGRAAGAVALRWTWIIKRARARRTARYLAARSPISERKARPRLRETR